MGRIIVIKMRRLTVVSGGCRSGKSRYAIERAKQLSEEVVYIATCQPQDDEMRERVERHRRERPHSWRTVEGELDFVRVLEQIFIPTQSVGMRDSNARMKDLNTKMKDSLVPTLCVGTTILIDCLTLWVSTHLFAGKSKEWILQEAKRTLGLIERIPSWVIVVTNEVGWGIVPENSLARNFRDLAGEVNQLFAKAADEVILMVAGIPVKLKE